MRGRSAQNRCQIAFLKALPRAQYPQRKWAIKIVAWRCQVHAPAHKDEEAISVQQTAYQNPLTAVLP